MLMASWVCAALLGQLVAAENFGDDRGSLHEAHIAAAEPSCVGKHELSTLPSAKRSATKYCAGDGGCPQLQSTLSNLL